MTVVSDVFDVFTARSRPYDDHESGDIAFVTNGYRDNGVVGFVSQLPEDKVFDRLAICVSAFCEATVQQPPFIARGNGGSGLTVLFPKEEMSEQRLWAYASFLSCSHRWKFSFGEWPVKPVLGRLLSPRT